MEGMDWRGSIGVECGVGEAREDAEARECWKMEMETGVRGRISYAARVRDSNSDHVSGPNHLPPPSASLGGMGLGKQQMAQMACRRTQRQPTRPPLRIQQVKWSCLLDFGFTDRRRRRRRNRSTSTTYSFLASSGLSETDESFFREREQAGEEQTVTGRCM